MSRRSRAAVGPSAARDRALTTLLGLVLLALGVLVVLLGTGVFGVFRAQRPVVDPIVAVWTASHVPLTRLLLVVGGLVLLVLGLVWAVRALRPEPRPDVLLDDTPGTRLRVRHTAVCEAVRADAETVPGVARARARMVGEEARPALRLALWLEEGTDVRDVWAEVDGRVLARARRAFEVSALPAAVRIELEADAVQSPRVR